MLILQLMINLQLICLLFPSSGNVILLLYNLREEQRRQLVFDIAKQIRVLYYREIVEEKFKDGSFKFFFKDVI